MSLKNLSINERSIILECLRASVEGPFFDDDDFHILFGLDREEVENVISTWANIDDTDKLVRRAINSSMNNLLGFPHNAQKDTWNRYISISVSELEALYKKWKRK
jgi:uncharacterized UPF0160 family protein